jgi:membrane fusion protein (multidrug efflux system)
MWRKILAAIGVVLVVVFVLGYIKYRQILAGIEQGKNFKLPPESVTTLIAKKETWRSSLSAIGTLTPYRGVTITSEEMGKIVEIAFESGQEVKAGDRLVQLDISVEQAQLRSAAARLALAQATLDRARALRQANANSQLELDQAEAELAQAEADHKALEARIERKTIRAPFDGKLGLRQVQLGQYLMPGTPIVSLQTLDPIYAEFTVPQFQIGRLRVGQPVDLAIQMDDAKTFSGTITAINPDVDPQTRNLRLQATISNPTRELLPGMFCYLRIQLDEEQEVFPLPLSAIARAPYGDSVYVVRKIKDTGGQEYTGAEQRFVKLGAMRGDQIAVLQGIEVGDEVITSGLFKLRPGVEIFINNEVQPANEKEPKPANR